MFSKSLALHSLKWRFVASGQLPGQATTRHFTCSLATGMGITSLVFLLATTIGCAPGRESLHELEHVQPEHWPSDLNDAAHKLRERLLWLTESKQNEATSDKPRLIQRELVDIVGWIPEIAADTDLDEKNWSEIQSATERIRQQLAQDNASLTASSQHIEALCELLHQKQQHLDALKTAAN